MNTPASATPSDHILRRGVIWNVASFAVIGLSGILMNVLVANFYEPWVLGTFNQVLAFYIVGGQLATFAIHYSVLYRVSVSADDPRRSGEAALTGILIGALISAVVCAGLWAGRGFLVRSPAVEIGLELALPGLFLFPINKIMMAMLSGLRRMGSYAVANAARYLLIVLAIIAGKYYGLSGERVALCLTVAEVVLFVGLAATVTRHLRMPSVADMRAWMRRHLTFGSRGVAGGLLVELNTRVDILILGAFTNDTEVGIYSIASIFAEGVFQLMLVLRTNYDPLLARLIAQDRREELDALIASGKRIGYTAMAVVGTTAVALYPVALNVLIGQPEFAGSWLIFAILIAGILISAGYIPFSGILQQGGHPVAQSMLSGTIVALNVFGNLLLVPLYGAVGAAAATAASQAIYPVVLYAMARYHLGIRI